MRRAWGPGLVLMLGACGSAAPSGAPAPSVTPTPDGRGSAAADSADWIGGRPMTPDELAAELQAAEAIERGDASATGLATTGSPGVASPAVSGPPGHVTFVSTVAADDRSLTSAQVAERVRRVYAAGLVRCYREQLKANPEVRGRQQVTFTVDAGGHVTAGPIAGPSPEVDGCIAGRITAWRFTPPLDADGEPGAATFTMTLDLRPE